MYDRNKVKKKKKKQETWPVLYKYIHIKMASEHTRRKRNTTNREHFSTRRTSVETEQEERRENFGPELVKSIKFSTDFEFVFES